MSGRIEFLDLHFEDLDEAAMIAALRERRSGSPFAYVVTPNVDHVVRLAKPDTPTDIRTAYAEATWCLCDSRVLQRLAAWRGVRLQVVPGSDLTWRFFDAVLEAGDRLCVIGGEATDVEIWDILWPDIEIVQHIPPMGLQTDPASREAAARFAIDSKARFTLLAVGSPQQEQIAALMAQIPGSTGTALCIGASLDFLLGRRRRAPRWMQRASLEWLHRLFSDPTRLWRRYLIEAPRIFLLAAKWRARG